MTFTLTHVDGRMERAPDPEALVNLLAELQDADEGHPDVAVSDSAGWCLSAFTTGLLVWENVEVGEPRHMREVSTERVLRLWRALAHGDLQAIEAQPWQPGYE